MIINSEQKEKNELASLVILSYNHENYIEETIKGALSQEYSPLEIVVSDDCSTDNTFNIIESILKDYRGPHIIKINRNETNMGLVPHLNKILFNFVDGDYILLNGGDDVSLSNRTTDVVSLFQKHTQMMGVVLSVTVIDKESQIIDKPVLIGEKTYILELKDYLSSHSFSVHESSISFRKKVIDVFGPFVDNCPTEDTTTHFRCMLLGGIIKGSEYGVLYRLHDTNMSRLSNVFKLKTKYIRNQYTTDLNLAYDRDYIDEKIYKKLKLKIQYYGVYRLLSEKIYNSKFPITYFYRGCEKLVSTYYKCLIKL